MSEEHKQYCHTLTMNLSVSKLLIIKRITSTLIMIMHLMRQRHRGRFYFPIFKGGDIYLQKEIYHHLQIQAKLMNNVNSKTFRTILNIWRQCNFVTENEKNLRKLTQNRTNRLTVNGLQPRFSVLSDKKTLSDTYDIKECTSKLTIFHFKTFSIQSFSDQWMCRQFYIFNQFLVQPPAALFMQTEKSSTYSL